MQIVSLGDSLHEMPNPIFLGLSPKETVCMICQILFPGKNKEKSIINFLSSEFVKVKERLLLKEMFPSQSGGYS